MVFGQISFYSGRDHIGDKQKETIQLQSNQK